MLAPLIDAATGDFKLIDGQIEVANYLLTSLYVRLITPRGKWLYGDSTYGSDLYKLEKSRSRATKQQLEKICTDALSPKILSREISNVNVVCTYNGIGKYKFNISCVDASSNYVSFEFKVSYNG
jgi:phage gp46-like protein